MRNEYEIEKELERFVDRNYFERHRVLKENGTIDEFLNSEDPIEVGGAKRILEFNAKLREKYKDDQLFQEEFDSFKCGVLKGKIAALRWVGGIDWDDIDPHITHDEFYTSKQKRRKIIMNNIICKENENKEFIVPTSEFNAMLKENGVKWEVVENDYIDCAMYTKNYSDKHEPFNYVMFKKFDIEFETFEYRRIGDKIISSEINLRFEFCKHSDTFNKLMECTIEDVTDYINTVKELLKNQEISSHEASYLMESKGLDIISLL